jgi:hypothetical protein
MNTIRKFPAWFAKQKPAGKMLIVSAGLAIFLCLCPFGLLSPRTPTSTSIPTRDSTRFPASTHTPTPTYTPAPTYTVTPPPVGAAFDNPSRGKGFACFSPGSCLDESGWYNLNYDDLVSGDLIAFTGITDMAACPDGTILFGGGFGVGVWDGESWSAIFDPGFIGAVACSATNEKWATHGYDVSHWNGSQWETFGSEQVLVNIDRESLACNDPYCLSNIAITPDGDLWSVIGEMYAAKPNLVLRFDGNVWNPVETPEHFRKIAADMNGRVWAISETKLFIYQAGTWVDSQGSGEGKLTDLIADTDGRVWISTDSGKVLVFNDGAWLTYDATDGGRISPYLYSLTLDGGGRLWVGSRWGVNVFDGTAWTAYHMHTADLESYVIRSLAVSGTGPDLPPPLEKERGSIVGKIQKDGQPVSGAIVQVCQMHMSTIYTYTDTPCTDIPLFAYATTGEDGGYRLEDLPPGWYSLFYMYPDGSWEYGDGFLVKPAETLQVEDIGN